MTVFVFVLKVMLSGGGTVSVCLYDFTTEPTVYQRPDVIEASLSDGLMNPNKNTV